jgi:putative membrane protein insertion efficiency factor
MNDLRDILKMRKILLWIIRLYRSLLSPIFPMSCRFTPTCSEYAMEAIQKYGSVTGLYLTARRLLRCHPFHPGGHDPVHPVRKSKDSLEPLPNDSSEKFFSSPNPKSGFSNGVK